MKAQALEENILNYLLKILVTSFIQYKYVILIFIYVIANISNHCCYCT